MGHQEERFDCPEDEIESISSGLKIPFGLRICVSTVSLLLISFCVYYTWMYIESPKVFASPKELSIGGIFIFSITALFVVWIPWGELGIRITKIGSVEFKDIVQGQASEHAEELSYLAIRIEFLEQKVKESDELACLFDPARETTLRPILLEFLTKYKKWAFSPSRIRVWGAKQQGFSSLSNYEHPLIRSTLQKLVSEGLLETRVSKKGNTLYRVPLF
ncbi:conserved hypothetical protein [Vibrio chagasii]|nr:conserved membrane hypothetical protein [Vibrio chagasii]CAH7010081.1 conserved hypothetical protein [Vibrio chagasii]